MQPAAACGMEGDVHTRPYAWCWPAGPLAGLWLLLRAGRVRGSMADGSRSSEWEGTD